MAVATGREYGLFIGGELVEPASGEIRELTEPATDSPLARVAIAGEADIDRAVELFPRLGERINQVTGSLSGGEQQMCAIARGLMAAPRLLMIDELSLGLAPRIVEELGEALAKINATGLSILLVEQDVLTALDLSHRAFVMVSGRVTLSGPSKSLADNPFIREAYLGVSSAAGVAS